MLDAYIETTLTPRRMRQVAEHLHGCSGCEALLSELRVIDALLATARSPGSVTPDFTTAVVKATRATQPRARRRIPLWLPLLGYLAIAWALVAFVQIRSHDVTRLSASLFET
ncbi:MAG: zf-HC2 domain-containing protein, partial [Candidatus Baltobacteraceae bacterium]